MDRMITKGKSYGLIVTLRKRIKVGYGFLLLLDFLGFVIIFDLNIYDSLRACLYFDNFIIFLFNYDEVLRL